MAVLDTLEILIEADSRGLETQLKKATSTITSFIDKMNSQEVNWESILAGSLDTAIIAGIASSFALAIEQTVQFQNSVLNMNNIATPATQSFADSINQIGGQAYQLAQSSGQSLGDAAAAFETFSKAGLDSATATYAVNAASQIAFATGEKFSTVVDELSQLFKNWGVTTVPQATAAVTGLANAVQNGQFSFDELVNAITPQGPFLSAKTNITDVSVSLAEMSDQTGVTKDTVLSVFGAISAGVKNKTADINLLVGDMSKYISSGPEGMITAFQAIKDKLDQFGPEVSTTIGTSMGLSKQDVAEFSNTTDEEFKIASDAADYLLKHLKSLNDITDANTPEVAKLTKAWNDLVTTFDSFVLPPAISALTSIFDGANEALKTMVKGISSFSSGSGFAQFIADIAGGGAGAATGAAIGTAILPGAGTLIGGAAGALAGINLAELGNTIATSIGNFFQKNTPSSQNPVANNTNVNLNTVLNVNGAGGNAKAVGENIGTQLYNHFQGTQ